MYSSSKLNSSCASGSSKDCRISVRFWPSCSKKARTVNAQVQCCGARWKRTAGTHCWKHNAVGRAVVTLLWGALETHCCGALLSQCCKHRCCGALLSQCCQHRCCGARWKRTAVGRCCHTRWRRTAVETRWKRTACEALLSHALETHWKHTVFTVLETHLIILVTVTLLLRLLALLAGWWSALERRLPLAPLLA